jgi:hypothetical protein
MLAKVIMMREMTVVKAVVRVMTRMRAVNILQIILRMHMIMMMMMAMIA